MTTRPGTRPQAHGTRLLAELPALRRFLSRLIGPRGVIDPEDVLQEVMERALRYAHTFDTGRAMGPWLRRAAFRVYLDQRRTSERLPAGGDAVADAPAREPAHTEAIAHRDEVRNLLSRLAPMQREILDRFHHRGQTLREIGAALGLPEGTVKSHLHRARRRLAAVGDDDGGTR